MSITPLPPAPSTSDPTNFSIMADAYVAAWNVFGMQVNAALAVLGAFPLAPAMGRLTLSSGAPVTTGDVTGATAVYYTPYIGNSISLYDGASWNGTVFSELTLTLDSTSAHAGYQQSTKNFDLYVFNDAGTIRLGSGPAWTSDTGRGSGAGTTELQRLNGIWVNKNSITLRWGNASGNTTTMAVNCATYVGTIRTTADGQTEDSAVKRFVWNAYNRRPRLMQARDATTSWTYTLQTYRQANASTTNQIEMVRGLDEDVVTALAVNIGTNSSAGVTLYVGVGLDSAVQAASVFGAHKTTGTTDTDSVWVNYRAYPGLGYHKLLRLEASDASGTTTWYGTAGVSTLIFSGIGAEVLA